MPTYLEEEVGQEFLNSIVATYKAQYVARHPEHKDAETDDAALTARMETFEVTGDSEAAQLAINDALGVTVEPVPEIREKRRWRKKSQERDPTIGAGRSKDVKKDDRGDWAS